MDESRWDRRAHWLQLAVTAIVAVTAWCVKLEINTSQQDKDFKEYKKEMKQTIKNYDDRLDELHDHVLTLEVEKRTLCEIGGTLDRGNGGTNHAR